MKIFLQKLAGEEEPSFIELNPQATLADLTQAVLELHPLLPRFSWRLALGQSILQQSSDDDGTSLRKSKGVPRERCSSDPPNTPRGF